MTPKMTEHQIARQIDEKIDASRATGLLYSIVDALYGPESDQEWGADTLDAIAQALDAEGLGPFHE